MITFRTSETEARFLRDLPIHKSQEETGHKDGQVTFSIFACPNKALIMEFCKYGGNIEVLSPKEVRESVAAELRKALRSYKDIIQ